MELLIFQIQDYFLVFSGLSLKVNIKQFEEYLIEEDSEKSEKWGWENSEKWGWESVLNRVNIFHVLDALAL